MDRSSTPHRPQIYSRPTTARLQIDCRATDQADLRPTSKRAKSTKVMGWDDTSGCGDRMGSGHDPMGGGDPMGSDDHACGVCSLHQPFVGRLCGDARVRIFPLPSEGPRVCVCVCAQGSDLGSEVRIFVRSCGPHRPWDERLPFRNSHVKSRYWIVSGTPEISDVRGRCGPGVP